MSARRTAQVGAALTLAAAVAGAARAGAPQPLPPPAATPARGVGELAPPQLRAQATTPVGAPPAGAKPAQPAARVPAAATPPPPAADEVDDELLEFLGSVGDDKDDGGDWLDFLASTDVDKVARAGARVPARGT